MPSELSPAAQILLGKLCTPTALDQGGAFVRYDSPEEAAYYELATAGRAEVFSLHNYGITARATAAGRAAFTGQPASDLLTTAPRKAEEATDA